MSLAAKKHSSLGLHDISSDDLKRMFAEVLPILHGIKCGKVKSDLHDSYITGSVRIINELKSRSNLICCITPQQYETIIQFLIQTFVSKSMKDFSYTVDVLYPEGMACVMMNHFSISKEEARHAMMTFDSVSKSSEDESGSCEPVSSYTGRQDLLDYIAKKRSQGPIYPLIQLLEATEHKNATNLVGHGCFGSVYKGLLRHTIVAVKFLNQEGCDSLGGAGSSDSMLTAELTALTKVRHPNIVPIMGFSAPPTPAIVYEYVSGGSLFSRLHKPMEGHLLQWADKTRILKDTCRGLLYLHSANPPIVHQDIKSHNILIDSQNSAKICDFGFAIELPSVRADGRSMFTAKSFARSEGYYPSELTSGQYSAKSDIYSYGVVMFETYSKMKAFCQERQDHKLVDHLEDELKSVELFKAVQDRGIAPCDDKTVNFFYATINRCLSRHSKRPSSAEVMQEWDC